MKRLTYLILLCTVACTNKQATVSVSTTQDSIIPPKVTILADLPVGLQPQTRRVDSLVKPNRYIIPKKGSLINRYEYYDYRKSKIATSTVEHKAAEQQKLPFVKTSKGEIVRSDDGKPYILGTGGMGHFRTFTTDDGLLMDGHFCAITDRKGCIWMGTGGAGLSRYDGTGFTHFTIENGLASNLVISMAEDKEGKVWFGMDRNLVSCYDGNTFTNFSLPSKISNDRVTAILQDKDGYMWFGTQLGGVYYYGDDTVIHHKSNNLLINRTRAIKEDKEGNVWIGTGGGLFCYDGQSFKGYDVSDGLPSNNIRAIEVDNDTIWLGTEKGISKYDGHSFTNFNTNDGLPSNNIITTKKDSEGNIWFGADNGVCKYDGEEFITYTTAVGLAGGAVMAITEDNAGNIWICTSSGGVSCFYGAACTYFNAELGMPNTHVYAIGEDKDGNKWFGTSGSGVSIYDGSSFTRMTSANGLSGSNNHCFLKDTKGQFWIGAEGRGLNIYDGQSFTNIHAAHGLVSNSPRCIFEDVDSNLWIGTLNNGVSKYNGQSFTNYTTKQGIADNDIRSITQDGLGGIWIATGGKGVSYFDGKSFANLTTAQGLADNYVWKVVKDETGNIWLGTNNGLALITADKIKLLHSNEEISGSLFRNYYMADGLPDYAIVQLLQLSNGKMAVGTTNGIATFNVSDDHSRLTDIEIYNISTGYPIKDLNDRESLFEDSEGIFWAATGRSKNLIVRLDLKSVRRDSTKPTVILRDVKINNSPVCWNYLQRATTNDSNALPAYVTEEAIKFGRKLSSAERDSVKSKFSELSFDSVSPHYYIPQQLVLPYENNEVTIGYGAIETGRPFMVNYQYILEGYDRDWKPITQSTTATFGNISGGTYTFKVKAQSPDGVWSEPIAYAFEVLPPWWATWWFRILSLLFIVSILYGIYKWRMNQVLKVELMRNSIAQDLHDEVGSTLSSVSIYASVAQKAKDKLPQNTASLLDKISNSTTRMMEGMNDIVWATKADNDTFEEVTNRMRAFAVNVTEAKDVKLRFNVEKGVEKVKVNMHLRKNIYLLFKEVVNNAIKHSECKHIDVELVLVNKKLNISIKDDGKGFDVANEQNKTDNLGGNGISGMKERARQIGAKLEIDSVLNDGTVVSLLVQL